MGKKIIWLVVSCLMLLTLVFASCGPTTPTETSTPPTTTPSMGGPGTTTGHAATPVYGGTLTTATTADYNAWDITNTATIFVPCTPFIASKMIQGDWTKGPQGTGQTGWEYGYLSDIGLMTGELASSWELPDPTTIIYHIDPNAHYFKNPLAAANDLVNGRAVTAQDVVWNITMQFNYPGAWQTIAYPPDNPAQVTDKILPGDSRRPTSVTAVDDHTVEVKVPATSQGIMLLEMGSNMYTEPPEIWTQSTGIGSWKDEIGSSAWILSDYVSGSSITYSKNPDYWETDPLYPGKNYKWPYADKLTYLIISDQSTLTTAIRTGKIDFYTPTFGGLTHDQAMPLISGSSKVSDLLYKKRINLAPILSMPVDKDPFTDIRVRQALNMAVDKVSWLNDYLKGDGELLGYPYPSDIDWAKYYTPLDQQPADVQELYQYNPDKAKQLLADAGYPNGFTATVTVSALAPNPDEVSAIASYFAKVGVTLKLDVLDASTYNAQNTSNQYDTDMWYGGGAGIWAPDEQLTTKVGESNNKSHLNDPYYVEVGKIIAQDMVANPEVYFKTMKEAGVHELESARGVFMPAPYNYVVWWPWVKNYDGIGWTGWAGAWQWTKSIFIDTNLKSSMGY